MRIEEQDALHECVMDAWRRTDAAPCPSTHLRWTAPIANGAHDLHDATVDVASLLGRRIAQIAALATALHLARQTVAGAVEVDS